MSNRQVYPGPLSSRSIRDINSLVMQLPPLTRPPALKQDATIGIIAPSKWAKPEDLNAATAALESAGYSIIHGSTNNVRSTPFGGTPKERADEIHQFFADLGA